MGKYMEASLNRKHDGYVTNESHIKNPISLLCDIFQT